MTSREKIDVEALITRAYREKAVHRLRNVGATLLGLSGPKGAGGGYSTDDKVDSSSFSARAAAATREMQARLSAAPDVLLDLHDAVLGLPDFYIERGAGLDFLVWDAETAARSGHRIEVCPANGASIVKVERRGGRGPGRDDLLVAGAPRRLTTLSTATIVLLNGQYGDRPYVPEVVVERMRPIYAEGRHDLVERYVPIYETGLQEIVEARATYAVWHAALGMVRASLDASPDAEVTGPAAPAEPWRLTGKMLTGGAVTDLVDEPVEAPAKRRRAPRKKVEKLAAAMA